MQPGHPRSPDLRSPRLGPPDLPDRKLEAAPTGRRRNRSVPILAAVVACAVVVAVVSQLLAARPKPSATPESADIAPLIPDVQALDTGGDVGSSSAADVARIRTDIDFWSARFKAHPLDFVSATEWGANEIALARTTGDLGAYIRANAAFDAALATFADNPAALGYKGGVLISLHKFADARDLASTILAKQPNDPVALATLGDASLELGDLAAARSAFERADGLAHSSATLVRLAHLAFIEGDSSSAVGMARKAVDLSDDEGAGDERAAWYRYQLGDVLLATGDVAGARSAMDGAVAADDGSYLAHWGRSRVLSEQGDLDGAIAEVSKAIAIVPQPEFLARRADLYTLRAKAGDAGRAARDQALVEAEAKLAGEASNVYDRTLVIYLANHGLEPARAVSLAEAEIAIRKDVYGYDALAWALLAAGRPTDARAAIDQALEVGTRDAKIYYHAGMIAAALGDREGARSQLEEALSIDPGFDPLQAVRARQTLQSLQ
jgi:tetratricopeptide (TPR) repeat protein